MDTGLEARARRHAALGEAHRLAIVEELAGSDRSPTELGRRLGIAANLLAHHLDVLEDADLIERFVSSGDRRRRYVRLRRASLADLGIHSQRPTEPIVFVCSHNSARSQLAAAMWRDRTGRPATSAGTRPADQVDPGAVAAAARIGLDLSNAIPCAFGGPEAGQVIVTVCDQAHEELPASDDWWHWSLPDPVAAGTDAAFDGVVSDLDTRIASLLPNDTPPPPPSPRKVSP